MKTSQLLNAKENCEKVDLTGGEKMKRATIITIISLITIGCVILLSTIGVALISY